MAITANGPQRPVTTQLHRQEHLIEYLELFERPTESLRLDCSFVELRFGQQFQNLGPSRFTGEPPFGEGKVNDVVWVSNGRLQKHPDRIAECRVDKSRPAAPKTKNLPYEAGHFVHVHIFDNAPRLHFVLQCL